MYGSRDSKYSDVAYITKFECAEYSDSDCDFVAEDFEVNGGSDYVIGDQDYFDHEIFYANDFKCPKCAYEHKFIEVKVG